MDADRFDYLFKFLIIGNASTGKTCILRRYTERKFFQNTQHTIGAEFGSRIINVDGAHVKIQIWDTAGKHLMNVNLTDAFLDKILMISFRMF